MACMIICLFMFQERKPSFLFNFLFESSHEGGKYSEEDIRDEINITTIGSDTSATTISFVLLMFATFHQIRPVFAREITQDIKAQQFAMLR
ncbi:cytochrome P450 4C1-like isoform X3 [Vespula maculifrons]|uniref:Cytochrome P450 4C1-like isoform X3 n=1 Tax=Vespula maculifrons TaxID=7453 RepID=A0ABD2CW13_VESMC